MKTFYKTIVLLFIIVQSSFGQELYFKKYNWSEPAQFESIKSEHKIILIKKEIHEFAYNQDNDLEEYCLKHSKEVLNTDEEIEEGNKIYLPFNETSEIFMAKARVIKPGNVVINLDESKIFESVDETTGQKLKYFAFEGIEKGSIIEYLVVTKKNPSYNGTQVMIQESDSIVQYNFELISPSNLIFKFLVKNDTSVFQRDTNTKEFNRWVLSSTNIPKIKYEIQSPINLLKKQLVYKLDRNSSTNHKDISSYGVASQNIYSNIHLNYSKTDEKLLKNFYKGMNIPENLSLDDKLFAVDNFIKSNIRIDNNADEKFRTLDAIVSQKITTTFGMVKLYALIFEYLGINYNIALTCDRSITLFDKDFESFNYITDYLIYIPETDKYIYPVDFAYRYGLIPAEYTDNLGLFIKETTLGEFKTGLGKIKYIEPASYETTYSDLNINATIGGDFQQLDLEVEDKSGGYYAVHIQPYLNLLAEEDLKEFIENRIKDNIEGIEISDWKVINSEKEIIGKEPLIVKFSGNNKNLIEKAGDKYLVKVGELIGPQMELYDKETRKLPVYNDFKRVYRRHITFKIPEGYKVKNPEQLIIYSDYDKDGKKVLLFDSKYSIENGVLNIEITEYYDQLYFTLEEYPMYRKIINSASDFNKVILILEKL